MDFNKLMSFAADVHVEKVRTKVIKYLIYVKAYTLNTF